MDSCNDSCSVYWRQGPPSLSCPPKPSATPSSLFQARVPHKNPVGKSQREASLFHFLNSLWPPCGGTSRLPSHPGAVHFRVIFPFPPTPGGRAPGVDATPAACAPLPPRRLPWPLSKGVGDAWKFPRENQPDEPLKPRTRQEGKTNNPFIQLHLYCLCDSVFILRLLPSCFSKNEGLTKLIDSHLDVQSLSIDDPTGRQEPYGTSG